MFMFKLSAGLVFAFVLAATNVGAGTDVRHEMTLRIINSVYQPAYNQFADSSNRLVTEIKQLCASGASSQLEVVHQSFTDAVAAFSVIEFYRVGPMLKNNRQHRLFYWPDTRRVGERQLRAVLADSSNFNRQTIDDKSVAVQGVVALERLLYDKAARADLAAPGSNSRCSVANTVAHNIAVIAGELQNKWADPVGIRQEMLQPTSTSEIFRSQSEVLRSFITQLSAGFEFLLDKKLDPLVADFQPSDAKKSFQPSIRKAPLWKSDNFLTNVRGNVTGLRALLIESGIAAEANLENELEFEFKLAMSHIDKLESMNILENDGKIITPEAEELLQVLAIPLASILITLDDRISSALGVSAGFNSDDGD